MKVALITTTIFVPKVLALYRKYGPDVKFFIACDWKTPIDINLFTDEIDSTKSWAIFPEFQKNWKCSELIGWNCIQRRNIALLEAVKWGADVIITIDDDVTPLNADYFYDHEYYLGQPHRFNGIKVSGMNGWFDPGQMLTPTIRHRGLPFDVISMPPELSTVTDARIGVMVGLWVGDADVDATHRIANPPGVTQTNALADVGVVIDPGTKTVWNAQNVGFIRELAPAMFQMPGIGRADDIFASLITQRVMREHNLHTHIGKPFTACWQNRSTASIIRDLEEEIFLYKHTTEFARYLDSYPLSLDGTILNQVRDIYADLAHCAWMPKQSVAAALAFLDDIEKIL